MEGLILVFRKSVVNTYYFAHTPVSIQDESYPRELLINTPEQAGTELGQAQLPIVI